MLSDFFKRHVRFSVIEPDMDDLLHKEQAFAPDVKFRHPDAGARLEVRHLDLSIGTQQILKDISLQIPENKITCIIGPSGCGKSTRPCPLPMSIYDNVAYGCRIHGIRGRRQLDAVVEHYLNEVGLWDEVKERLRESATGLSIGQQQRLCLARSLAVEPEFILADEATSALDPQSSKTVEDLFVKLKEHYSIIMVTHTLRQALRIADYVVFIYMGEIIETGNAGQVFHHPQHELTRNYLSGVFS